MSYRTLGPVGFTSDGKGVTCLKAGVLVEVDAAQAKELVAAGKLEPVKESKPADKPKVES